MIQAREFTSAAECIASAEAIRAKFMATKPARTNDNRTAEGAVKTTRKIFTKRTRKPLWKSAPILFDEHVVGYRVRKIIRELEESGQIERVPEGMQSMEDITREVLKDYPGVSVREARGASRSRRVFMPRAISMYEIRKRRPDKSLPDIGRYFGGRDHSTVIYSIRFVAKMRGEL